MCTNPIVINRRFGTKTRQDLVPCGKCHECLLQKQSQFAALSAIQAQNSDSVYFLTLTYDNVHVPLASKWIHGRFPVVYKAHLPMDKALIETLSKNKNDSVLVDEHFYTLSLCRKDLQCVLKRFREYGRKHDWDLSKWSYSFFGEYGEHTARPHYHGQTNECTYPFRYTLKHTKKPQHEHENHHYYKPESTCNQ